MNLVLINRSHPEVPHISSTRSWRFARELATRGHRVVQICQATDATQVQCGSDGLDAVISAHNWSEPLLIAVPTSRRVLLDAVRSRRTPAVIRKGLVAYSFAVNGGVCSDFSDGARLYLKCLARVFRPDAVWGVFLFTDCWLIAQRLARIAKCPWIADIKDSWDAFIPKPLQLLLARRYGDMVACTANSRFTGDMARQLFGVEATVVYSGVDRSFVEPHAQPPTTARFRITLTGGLYEQQSVERWVAGVRAWLNQRSSACDGESDLPEVVYAGGDSRRAAQVLEPLAGLAEVKVHGYLPLEELAALCQSASVNAYIRTPKTFHHKLLELLSCGRPVIAFPGETDESRRLADQCGGTLVTPTTERELVAALQSLWDSTSTNLHQIVDPSQFSWARQAQILEGVLRRAAGRG